MKRISATSSRHAPFARAQETDAPRTSTGGATQGTLTTSQHTDPPRPALSAEAQAILRGIEEFSLPFLLNDDTNPNGDGMGKEKSGLRRQAPRAEHPPSHNMACGNDVPIPAAVINESRGVISTASGPFRGHGTISSKSAVNSAAASTDAGDDGSGDAPHGAEETGLVGFNVNPLMRRGRDDDGGFNDILVMEQKVTLLAQYTPRGGPLLEAASLPHEHHGAQEPNHAAKAVSSSTPLSPSFIRSLSKYNNSAVTAAYFGHLLTQLDQPVSRVA